MQREGVPGFFLTDDPIIIQEQEVSGYLKFFLDKERLAVCTRDVKTSYTETKGR